MSDAERFEYESSRELYDLLMGSDPDYQEWLYVNEEADLAFRMKMEAEDDEVE